MNLVTKVFRSDRRYFWIALGVITYLLKLLTAAFPIATERIYSRGIFPVIRYIVDYTIALLPIPLFYFFAILLVYLFVRGIRRLFVKKKAVSLGKRVFSFLLSIVAVLSIFYALFFVLWAFNYNRIPVEQQIGLKAATLQKEDIIQAIDKEVALAMQNRHLIKDADTLALATKHFDFNHQDVIRPLLKKVLQDYNFQTPGNVRVMELFPKGILLRFGTAGIYLPFTSQGQIDAGLHHIDKPYTLAHEMAHGYGFGDEGTCNFWAYLACIESNLPAMRYSGHFNYLEYLLVALKRIDREQFTEVKEQLPLGIRNDLTAKKIHNDQYPDIVSAAPFNDAYLKSQGVKEGILSYSRVIQLVAAWRAKND